MAGIAGENCLVPGNGIGVLLQHVLVQRGQAKVDADHFIFIATGLGPGEKQVGQLLIALRRFVDVRQLGEDERIVRIGLSSCEKRPERLFLAPEPIVDLAQAQEAVGRVSALEVGLGRQGGDQLLVSTVPFRDRKSTRLNSSHQIISYAVFCLKKKKKKTSRQRSQYERLS